MNNILFITILAIAVIFSATSLLITRPHKNIILENTLPVEALTHPDVKVLTTAYKKKNFIIAGVICVCSLPLLFLKYDSLSFIWFFICLYATMIAFYFNQIRAIGKMNQLKLAHNWQVSVEKGVTIDTTLLVNKNEKIVSFAWFIPSIIVSAVGAILVGVAFSSVLAGVFDMLVLIVMQGIFTTIYQIVKNSPVKPLTEDSTINQKINDSFVHAWSMLAVTSCGVFALINLFFALSLYLPNLTTLTMIALLVIIFAYMGYVFALLLHARHQQDLFLAATQKIIYRDDDQYWRYGIYNNPHDKRLNVPDRVGTNIALNFGRPAGKIIYGLLAILLLALPIGISLPMLQGDFSPNAFAAKISDDTLTLSAPLADSAKIKLTDIAEVTSLNKLPKLDMRVAGTATTHFYTGLFMVDGKKAHLYIYQPSSPIIKIKTTTGATYYFAGKNSADATQLLKKIAQP